MIVHYANDSATPEWMIESATLEHAASGSSIEFRDGQVIIDGVVSVPSWANARELVTGEAA